MHQTNSPLYIILATNNMSQDQVSEINQHTRELGALLESHSDAVQSVSVGEKNDLPQGIKVAGELVFGQQIVLMVTPILRAYARKFVLCLKSVFKKKKGAFSENLNYETTSFRHSTK